MNSSKIERKRLWQAAIKWPLYSVAVMPLLLAAGWKIGQGEGIQIRQFLGFLIASILILFWENLTNDLFDNDTGVDQFKLHSVVALVGKKAPVSQIAYLSLALGLLLTLLLALKSNLIVLPLILVCCCLGYLYQGPPFRLGYKGLGEPLCWLAFGPLATTAALLVLSPKSHVIANTTWPTASLISAGPALATTLVLFCSHFHQVNQDAKHGKNSPLVVLGTRRGAQLIPWIIFFIMVLELLPIINGTFPISAILSCIGLPSGINLIRLLSEYHNKPSLIKNSKFLALRFQTLNGIGLSIGFALPSIFAGIA